MTISSRIALLIAFVLVSTALVPMAMASGVAADDAIEALEVMPMPVPDYMRFIQVNSFKFDPLAESPSIPSFLKYEASSVGLESYYLVQFDRPITSDMKASLAATGATVLHYVNYNAYVVRATAYEMSSAGLLPEVRWTGVFEPAYKLSPRLSERYDEMVMKSAEDALAAAHPPMTVSFGSAKAVTSDTTAGMSFDKALSLALSPAGDFSDRKALALERAESSLRTSGSRIVIEVTPFESSSTLDIARAVAACGGTGIIYSTDAVRAEIDRAALPQLARAPDVMWIDRFVQPHVYNDIARWVLQSADDITYSTPIHDMGIWGTNQTVTVGDTGIDYEHDAFEDPSVPSPGATHRKVTDYYIPPGAGGDMTDNDINHGTHVSGTVAGDDGVWHVYDGDPTGSNGSAGPHDGQAFDAKVQVQDLSPDGYWVFPPADFHDMYQPALDRGSWIHTNSWGSAGGEYNGEVQQTDDFLWDNQDFIILYAAGNSGSSPMIISPYAAAKNTIGVGASMNGVSMDNMASFSSRGPAADGRMKPDVTAPGVGVWSARGGDPGGELDTYWQLDGTSMATPNAAGSVALIRQYYMDGWYPTGTRESANSFTPSAALVKATLINGAVEMTGSGAYDNGWSYYPNPNQGWGRILLDNALYFQGEVRGLVTDDNRAGMSTGGTATYQLAIGDDSTPVEITLVWTDYPGVPYTSPALVNDLDLIVTAPDGTIYLGNRYYGMNPGESEPNPGGWNATDRINNVESVLVITNVQTGLWTVEVDGYNVPMGPQPYAIVMSGGIATERGIVQMDRNTYRSSAIVNLTVVDTDLNINPGAVDNTWALARSPGGDLENLTLAETGISTSVFKTWFQLVDSAVPIPGDGNLQVQNLDVISAEYYDENDGLGGSGWTTDQAVIDDDPPLISGVGVTNIRFNRATIIWTTDESSNSMVYYGTATPPGTTKSDSLAVISHAISLSSLAENTTYYFSVQSTDGAGNTALDDNSSAYYSFRTTVRPPTAPPDYEWPTFHNNQPRQGISPSAFDPPLAQMWTAGPHNLELWTSPVLKDGILYATTLDGYLRARDPYSGQVLWQRHLGGTDYYTGTPVVDSGVIYSVFYGGSGGAVHALDAATGETIWTVGTESGLDFNARVALAYADGLIFGSTWSGQVYALDAADGSIEWLYSAPGWPWGGATVNQGMVFFPCENSMLALDEFSGSLVWSTAFDDICAAPPLFAQGMVYEGTYAGTMYALNAETGAVVWTTSGFGIIDYSTPAYDGAAIYFASFGPSYEGMYISLDATDGSLLWQRTLSGYPPGSSVAYANGYLYGTAWDGILRVLDSFDGTIVQSVSLDPSGSTCSPAVSDGWVWVEDFYGNIYGFFGQMPVALTVAPSSQVRNVVPGTTVDYSVNVTNIGNSGPDTFDATITPGALGWTVDLYEADGSTLLPDTDADSVPDTGSLPTGSATTVIIRVTVPAGALAGDTDTATVTFRSSNDLLVNKSARVTSTVPPPGLWIGPRAYFSPDPGETVTAAMEVRNTGGFPDTFDITASSVSGWTVTLLMADGVTPLTDTDGDLVPDTGVVAALGSAGIVVQIDVPLAVPLGTVDRTNIVGTSSLNTSVDYTNTVTIELVAPPNEEWPTFHNDMARRGISPDLFAPPADLQWTAGPYYANILTGPVLADGILFATTLDGAIRAHNPYTGAVLWQRTLGGTDYYTATPTVADGVVYAPFYTSSEQGYVYALDELTGETLWVVGPETGIDYNARIAMATAEGMLFGSAWSGEIFALSASNGSAVWTYQTGDLPWAGPAIGAGMLYQGTIYTAQVYALDMATGAFVWSQTLDGEVASTPLVAQGCVYVGTYAGTMYCLDAASGDIIWETSGFGTFFYSTPAYGGTAIYFGSLDGFYYALDALDGSVLWSSSNMTWGVVSSPVYSNGYIYGTDLDSYLRVYDADDGSLVDSDELMGWESSSSPAADDGWIWVQDYSGYLYGFLAQVPVGLRVDPTLQSKEVAPSQIVDYTVTVTNTGILGLDTFDATVTLGPLGWSVELLQDDGVTPLPDTDGDSIPDTGALNTGQAAGVVIRVSVPAGVIAGDVETSVVRFTSSNDANISKTATVISEVPPPGVEIGPSAYISADPGEHLNVTVEVRNTGAMPDTMDIAASASLNWTMALMHDDGVTPLTDTDGDGAVDSGLMDGLASMQIMVLIDVDPDAPLGTVAQFELIAASSLDTLATDTATVLVELLGPPSNEWPTFKQNNMRTARAPVDFELPLTEIWSYWAGWTTISRYGPVIDGGTAYFSDTSGEVHAVDVGTGDLVWSTVAGSYGEIAGGTAVAYGNVYTALSIDNGSLGLVCLDADTGSILWSYEESSANYSSPWTAPVVAAGNVYWTDFGAGTVNANNALTGELVWSYTMPDNGWPSEPSYWSGMVFAIDDMGNIVALDAVTGELVWLTNIGSTIYSAPTIDNGKLFVCDAWGWMYALDATTGGLLWTLGGLGWWVEIAGPTVADGMVYVGTDEAGNGRMHCIDAESGYVYWSDWLSSAPITSASAYTNGVVLVAANDGYLYGWNALTGARLVQMPISPWTVTTSVAIGDGFLVVGDGNGYVTGFRFAGGGEVSWIEVTPASAEIAVASAAVFEANAYNEWGLEIDGIEFTWDASAGLGAIYPLTADQDVVAYVSGGITGTDVLVATTGNFTANATVSITPGEADHVVVSPSVVEVTAGSTQQFTATAVDRYGNEVPGTAMTWSVTGAIGSVDDSGMLAASTATGAGTVVASCAIGSAFAVVQIVPDALESVHVTPSPISANCGCTIVVEAMGYDQYENDIEGLDYTWSTTVGSIEPIGDHCSALLNPGFVAATGTLTASCGDCDAQAAVTVLPGPLDHVDVSPEPAEVEAGSTLAFTADPQDFFGNTIAGMAVTWSASPAAGTITQSGLLTASLSAGTGLVTATVGSESQSVAVEIVPGPLAGVDITPGDVQLPAGGSQLMTASGEDEYGNEIEALDVTWSASSGGISTLSADGGTALFVAPTQAGSAVVSASAGGMTADVTVTVVAGAADRLVVSPAAIVLERGETTSIEVTAEDIYGNAVDVDQFTWSTDIGTISTTGDGYSAEFDAGDEEGTGTITVSGGGKSLTVPVMVSGGAATFGEQIAQPSSIALLVAVIVLAALCVILFMKNQQLARQVKQGGGSEEPKGPETQKP